MNKWLLTGLVVCAQLIQAGMQMARATERLVVAGGSVTEIVYALGAGKDVVGRDSSSNYPGNVHSLPDVGYYRTLNVEGILSVSPTKVIMLKGAGPENVLQQLDTLGVERVMIENPKSIDGLIDMVQQVAAAVGKEAKGEELVADIQQQLKHVSSAPDLGEKTAVFLMSAGERGLIAAGQNTTPQLIFDSLNVSNPFTTLNGFQPISAESLAQVPPDIILVASHTTRGLSTDELCQSPQLILWAQQKGCQLIKIDSLKYIGLTPRLPEAIQETHAHLYDQANHAD